ncbi:GNAT family N-acetyltransferase [Edaphobacter sp. 12200R-103]|uniref:GNAT family N-acetyltransferase n=1 Tax=Edaphobacter sp. 12200R-103 TaxID=2703788 RepID=UPI00138C93A0|nr:GNAT family N-acetyltransferase [Edaphobacter sp. 12200R-103]QHS51886.1 N-acetyltransferase [Edaphobacter sp. 12200R-103]
MPRTSHVTRNRFEYEDEGKVAYLEFETDDLGWITLLRTEVPNELRGRGIAGELVRTAFEYAREHRLRVDVLCPLAADYLKRHPELRGDSSVS